MKAVIYARTATKEQQIETQIEACHNFANTNGYEVVDTFVDHGHSTHNEDRPGLVRMKEFLKDNPDISIIVSSVDRLTRTPSFDDSLTFYLTGQFQLEGIKVIVAEKPKRP